MRIYSRLLDFRLGRPASGQVVAAENCSYWLSRSASLYSD